MTNTDPRVLIGTPCLSLASESTCDSVSCAPGYKPDRTRSPAVSPVCNNANASESTWRGASSLAASTAIAIGNNGMMGFGLDIITYTQSVQGLVFNVRAVNNMTRASVTLAPADPNQDGVAFSETPAATANRTLSFTTKLADTEFLFAKPVVLSAGRAYVLIINVDGGSLSVGLGTSQISRSTSYSGGTVRNAWFLPGIYTTNLPLFRVRLAGVRVDTSDQFGCVGMDFRIFVKQTSDIEDDPMLPVFRALCGKCLA